MAVDGAGYGSSTHVSTDEYQNQVSTRPKVAAEKEDDEFEHPVARTHPDTGRLTLNKKWKKMGSGKKKMGKTWGQS